VICQLQALQFCAVLCSVVSCRLKLCLSCSGCAWQPKLLSDTRNRLTAKHSSLNRAGCANPNCAVFSFFVRCSCTHCMRWWSCERHVRSRSCTQALAELTQTQERRSLTVLLSTKLTPLHYSMPWFPQPACVCVFSLSLYKRTLSAKLLPFILHTHTVFAWFEVI
jgi:hypothetical protein